MNVNNCLMFLLLIINLLLVSIIIHCNNNNINQNALNQNIIKQNYNFNSIIEGIIVIKIFSIFKYAKVINLETESKYISIFNYWILIDKKNITLNK